MTSRSATVLVIFIIAIFAFCLASVFAAMTGPISILPQESDSGGILDNLSAITDDIDNDNSYGYQQYDDYSSNDYSDDNSDDSSNLETTTDDSQDHADVEKQKTSNDNIETTTEDTSSSNTPSGDSGSKGSSNIETTTDG